MAEDDDSETPSPPPKRNVLREIAEGQTKFSTAHSKLMDAVKGISPNGKLMDAIKGTSHLHDALTKNVAASDAMKAISESSSLGKFSEMMKSINPPDLGFDNIHRSVIADAPHLNVEAFKIPPNPVYDTNEKLELLIEQTAQTNELLDSYVKQSAALLSSLNDSILEVASATALEAKTTRDQNALDAESTRKQNSFMIFLAMLGILITGAFSIWGVIEKNQDISTKELQTTISKGFASLTTPATQERPKTNDKAIDKLSGKADGSSKAKR